MKHLQYNFVIGWTIDCNSRPSFTELESTMEDFYKNEPVKHVFTVVSMPVISICMHNVYCLFRVMQFYKFMIYQKAVKRLLTSIHIQLKMTLIQLAMWNNHNWTLHNVSIPPSMTLYQLAVTMRTTMMGKSTSN